MKYKPTGNVTLFLGVLPLCYEASHKMNGDESLASRAMI